VAARLTTIERDCIYRFVGKLSEQLGDKLAEVWLFGSAARGEMWAEFWPMRSDIDLLVVISEPLAADFERELVAATYPLFLECGRQISPAFRTRDQLRSTWAPLQSEVSRDGVRLWPQGVSSQLQSSA
jgi:predicted nucleotidyltransferase